MFLTNLFDVMSFFMNPAFLNNRQHSLRRKLDQNIVIYKRANESGKVKVWMDIRMLLHFTKTMQYVAVKLCLITYLTCLPTLTLIGIHFVHK